MINPQIDAQRDLQKHFNWELRFLALRIISRLEALRLEPKQLVAERLVSPRSLDAFLNRSEPVDIATLVLIAQRLRCDLKMAFINRVGIQESVSLKNAGNIEIARAINAAFRNMLRGTNKAVVARMAGISPSTVAHFDRIIPYKMLFPTKVTVPDLITVFKCARGCGYETYLFLAEHSTILRSVDTRAHNHESAPEPVNEDKKVS